MPSCQEELILDTERFSRAQPLPMLMQIFPCHFLYRQFGNPCCDKDPKVRLSANKCNSGVMSEHCLHRDVTPFVLHFAIQVKNLLGDLMLLLYYCCFYFHVHVGEAPGGGHQQEVQKRLVSHLQNIMRLWQSTRAWHERKGRKFVPSELLRL
jgi:hypothetical protein